MRTQHRIRLSAALVILAHTVNQAQAAGGDALAKEEKEDICGLASELAKYPSYVNTKIKAAADAASDLLTHELKLHIYTQQHDTATAKAMIPILAALVDKKQHSIVGTGSIAKGIEAAAAAARLNGRLVETVEFLADLHQNAGAGTAAGCLSLTGGTVVQGKRKLGSCGQDLTAVTTQTTTPLTKLTATGFVGLKSAKWSTAHGAGTAACRVFHTGSGNGVLDGQLTTDGATLAGGYIKLNSNSADHSLEDLRDLTEGKDPGKPSAFKTAYTTFKEFQTDALAAAKGYQPITLADIKASQAARAAVKLVLLSDATKYDQSKDESATTRKIDETYGNEADFADKWTKKYIENEIQKISCDSSGDGTEPLTDIKDVDKLRKILTYYTGVREAAVATKLKKAEEEIDKLKQSNVAAKKPPETAETCEKKGPGNECISLCKAVEEEGGKKKCTLSEETKKVAEKEAEKKKEEKYAGKPQGERKSPYCKWEGET